MGSSSSLRESLAIQGRVVWALLMREVITRFGRENIGVLWLVGEPMLFTLGVATLWTAAQFHTIAHVPVAAFAITGYSSVLMWRNTVNRCATGIPQNLGLLHHRNVRVLDVFLTRILLEIAGATASFTILSCICWFGEWIEPPADMLTVVVGWVLLGWFGAGLALLVGAAASYSDLIDRLWHPTQYLLFPLSGAAFMVDWLPEPAQRFVLLLPMVHGVEMIREGYFGRQVHTHYDVAYMAFVNLILTLAGLFLLRDAGRRVGQR